MNKQLLRALGTLLLTLVCLPAAARASAERDALLGSLPGEPAFCLAVQDARGKWEQIERSPFWERFQRSPLHARLREADWVRKLTELDEQLQMHLQVNLAQLRDDVLGDALLFAYWPATNDAPERALFLARARDQALAERVLARLTELQVQSGEVQSATAVVHRGVTFHRCVEQDDKLSCRAVVQGTVLIGTEENLVKQWLDRKADGKPGNPLAQEFKDLDVASDCAVLYLNPRPFDQALLAKIQAAQEPEASFLRALHVHWKQLTGAAIALDLNDSLDVRLVMRSLVDGLPQPTQQILRQAARPSRLWSLAPANSLFAAASSFDFAAFVDLLLECMPRDEGGKKLAEIDQGTLALLGMGFRDEILQALGHDWIFYVAPAPSGPFIPDVVFAMAMRAPKESEVEANVRYALNTLAGILATEQTRQGKPARLKRTKLGNSTVFQVWSESGAQGHWQLPATVPDGHLLVANSPDAIRRVQERMTTPTQPAAAKSIPLASVSGAGLSKFLGDKDRLSAVAGWLSELQQRPKAEVEEKLQHLAHVFEHVQSMELTQEHAPGRTAFRLRIQPRHALRR